MVHQQGLSVLGLRGFDAARRTTSEATRRPRPGSRVALALYATHAPYVVATLVFVRLLRRLSLRDDADIVVLHPPLPFVYVRLMRRAGAVTRLVAGMPPAYEQHYRHCFVKLGIFELTEYDRVVFVDADSIPLKNLDYLFSLPFDGPVAAPPAYWLPQPWWGSHLMVVKPSVAAMDRVMPHLERAFEQRLYDMDIVNVAFRGEIQTLPPETACLNSEWEDARRAGFFGDPEAAYANASVVHFTALGKPWSYHPAKVRQLRPHAHAIFHHLWETWWRARDELSDLHRR